MSGDRRRRNGPCPCGSKKKYGKCCYPRTFPSLSKPNAGIPRPSVHRNPLERYYGDSFAPGVGSIPVSTHSRQTQPVYRDRGFPYSQVLCAPLPPFGDGAALAGTLAPPTPEQYRGMFEAIRRGDPRNPTEVLVQYSYPEMFGHAEVQLAMRADETVILEDGRLVDVVDLWTGMRLQMENGSVGTVTQDRTLLHEMPDPPRPWKDGLWLSRVIGSIKHFGYEVIDLRCAGQTITVTPDHPFWSASRHGWVAVGELSPGELLRVCGNVVAPVEAIGQRRRWNIELFNVEVEYFHNYFVGKDDNAVLVHNGPGYILRPKDPGLFDDMPDPEGPLSGGVRSLRDNQYDPAKIAYGRVVRDTEEMRAVVGDALQATGTHRNPISGLYAFLRRDGGSGFQGVTRNPLDRLFTVIRNFGKSSGEVNGCRRSHPPRSRKCVRFPKSCCPRCFSSSVSQIRGHVRGDGPGGRCCCARSYSS